MNIKPLPGQCLLRILPHESVTASGLHLPDIAHTRLQGEKQKPDVALVIAVNFKRTKNGFAILPDFAPGDKVLANFYSGTNLNRTIGEHLRLCSVDSVLCKFC